MATPPTFIQEAETVWNTTTSPKGSGNFTTSTNDVVVAAVISENNVDTTLDISATGTNVTLATQASISQQNYCQLLLRTGTVSSGGTTSVSFADSVAEWFGGNALTFRGSDGVGNSATSFGTTGAPSLAITTTQDNSAIVVITADWNAVDGASRTWRTVNSITPTAGNGYELSYFRDSAHYTLYIAYYPDAGAAGSKTVGLSAPTGQKWQIAAVEIKGAAASGSTGTLAKTNANDTVSASGTTTIVGSLAKTNANDTSSAAGTTTVLGTLAKTAANDTVSASGSVGSPVSGTLAATNANDTSSASGTTTILGTLAKTSTNDSSSGAGTTTILGSLAKTNGNDTVNASGSVGSAVSGSANVTAGNDTSSGAGTTTVIGSLTRTNVDDSIAAVGTTTILGSLSKTAANDSLSASGTAGPVVASSFQAFTLKIIRALHF